MEAVDVGPSMRVHPSDICKVRIFGEDHRKGVSVMEIPGADKFGQDLVNARLIGGTVFGRRRVCGLPHRTK
jgi:hypothetical protein